jgi:Asp-tRNA(Asn)/Glu-tRNA(Gln) amidotransferase A subunit family amidase
VEAAAAFDELTRSDRDDSMVRQVEQAWPNIFRAAQLVPAVQYVQAQRARTLLARRFAAAVEGLDAYVSPAFMGPSLLATNLTGHPAVVFPNGFRDDGTPTSMTVIGKLYGEAEAVAVASVYQSATDWHRRHPAV